jgi:hypothetical protein
LLSRQELEPELEPVPTLEAVALAELGKLRAVVATVELGDGGTPAAQKQGERLVASPPGDEPPSPAVRLRRFQVLEHRHSSGDTTVIDKDRLKHTHTSGIRPISGISL